MARLLGIDIGTTGVRVALFEPHGTLVAEASVPCLYDSPEPGFAEIRPDRWWQATQAAVAELSTKAGAQSLEAVAAIAVVGQAPTVALVDADGSAPSSAILWLDTRATKEAETLETYAYYAGPKLAWLAKHGSRSLERAKWILQSHAFVAYRLTGEVATDPSTAALCLPLFDLSKLEWRDDAVCAKAGVRRDQLPPIKKSSEVIGGVTTEAAQALGHGLKKGTPVVAGGGDFAAATLGAGVVAEGEACLMLGTAGNLLVPRKTPGKDARLINAHHVGADAWLSLGGTLSGGAQEWLRYALSRASSSGHDGEDTAVRNALPAFDMLEAEAEQVSVGSEGLLFLPYLQGERTPIWNTDARGAFVGLSLNHGRGHLYRAVLEGIALGFVDSQEVLEQDGVKLKDVVAANGGGKSALFRQILCDALGVPLSYTPAAGGTVAGAAMLAALHTGALKSSSEARKWRGSAINHDPNVESHNRYRELLSLRRKSYEALKPVFTGLAKFR